jgi:aspartate carbamoyltransferase regulatory subunit
MSKMLSVQAIRQGTVIDHIPTGQGITVLHVLGLTTPSQQITIGLHLASDRLKQKDLIKITDKLLATDEICQVGVFAPQATINIIADYQVCEKIHVQMPTQINALLLCPNPRCITHHEQVDTLFYVQQNKQQVELCCHYCERVFPRSALEGRPSC